MFTKSFLQVSLKNEPADPRRSLGLVWRGAASGVSGQSPERASADALSAVYRRVCGKCACALMRLCLKLRRSFAPDSTRASLWTHGRVSVASLETWRKLFVKLNSVREVSKVDCLLASFSRYYIKYKPTSTEERHYEKHDRKSIQR